MCRLLWSLLSPFSGSESGRPGTARAGLEHSPPPHPADSSKPLPVAAALPWRHALLCEAESHDKCITTDGSCQYTMLLEVLLPGVCKERRQE
eukprot:scaffold489_cov259-Pinguiococcus_pyrenoidosus.AAC.34